MMYWLAENLVPHVSGFNLFLYVTARAVFAVLTALSIGLMLGPWFINQMKKSGRGQQVRDDGPERHLAKNNTPTMGGLLILSSLLLTTLIWADLSSRQVLAVLGVTVAFGLIGFWDDWTKISRKTAKACRRKINSCCNRRRRLSCLPICHKATPSPVTPILSSLT